MDNPMRGIVLLLAATFLFCISDVFAKILGEHLPVIEIGWIRYLTFVVMILGANWHSGRLSLRVQSWRDQVFRGVMLVASAILFIYSLRYLALADAAAVGFVSPLLITMLSVPMLRETVGVRRWLAICVGFVGVLIVIRPGMGTFQPAAFLVLASSLAWAFASILTRRMATTEDIQATLLWSSCTGLVLLSVIVPFDFVVPSWSHLALNVALGVIASVGQYLTVLAYRYAGAALLAPFSYIQLIWAISLGYMFFGTLPDQITLVGSAVIVASGLYTIHRERIRRAQKS